MMSRRSLHLLSLAGAFVSAASARATTYYVSPTGSDSNSGTSPGSAWQSLAQVDATNFAPGSTILFQDGGNWYGSQLVASGNGTPSQPITYGSYGSGAAPTFWGSVPVSYSSLEWYMGTTYFYPSTTPVNAFFINHQFTHNADLLTGSTDPSTNENYVVNNVNTSYYVNAGADSGVLVNTGIPYQFNVAYNTFSAAVQQNVISALYANNVVFNNLTVRESAAENGGYGISVENSSNVEVLNCTVTGAGKHAIGVVDSTGFVGENLTASNLLPDQNYGGATAFAAYADANVSNTTSQWINCTFTNPGGQYQGFIVHSDGSATDASPISSVLLQNPNFNTFPAITIDSANSGENVNIVGGTVTGDIQLNGNGTVVNGTTLNGTAAEIQIVGSNNTVENTIINGDVPNWTSNRDGAIILNGANNIIRFNSIELGPGTGLYEAAIAIMNGQSNDQIYANVINSQYAAFFMENGGLPGIIAHDNLLSGYSTPEVIYPYASAMPVADWPTSVSANELFGDADFADASDGDLSLSPDSIGAYVFDPATNEYVMYDYYGNVRPSILESLGAIQAPAFGTGTGWNVDSDGNWSNSANWTNNNVPNSTDIIALLGPGITVPRTVTVDMPETVGVLYFSSSISYTVAGSSTLTFNSSSGASAIDVSAGNHTISAPLDLTDPTAVNLAPGSVLTIDGVVGGTGSMAADGQGTLVIGTNASIGVPVVVNGNLTFASNGHTGGILVQQIVSLEIGREALATLADPGAGNHSNRTLLVTGALNFDATVSGLLDLNGNDMDVQEGDLAQITAAIASGYNGGNWNGAAGIISSAAASDTTHLTALGVILNSTGGSAPTRIYGRPSAGLGKFDGTRPGLNDVLVKYTYYGDANLDGQVDGSDYALIDNGYLTQLTGWYNGDFNYDGVIDGSDYTLIDNSYNTQGASLASQVNIQTTAEIASVTAVPEPAASILLLAALVPALGRRRRIGKRGQKM